MEVSGACHILADVSLELNPCDVVAIVAEGNLRKYFVFTQLQSVFLDFLEILHHHDHELLRELLLSVLAIDDGNLAYANQPQLLVFRSFPKDKADAFDAQTLAALLVVAGQAVEGFCVPADLVEELGLAQVLE